jgi:hypothetical protein
MSVLIRDVVEVEEVTLGKSVKLLPLGVLLACKQVEQIACILPIVWDSLSEKAGVGMCGPFK